jgi:uncharacterized protein (DUF1330 family)
VSAYIVVEARVSDWARFSVYAEQVPELVARFGGTYLVLGGDPESLEGEWGDTRLVIHHWPHRASALRFWNSPAYREVAALRAGTGEFRVMLVEGCRTIRLD